MIGGSLTLHCPATGVPRPDIQWTRRGKEMVFVSEPNVRVLNAGRELQLFNAHLPDAGAYTCNASNTAGSASKQFKLNIIGESISTRYFLQKSTAVICSSM